MTRSLPMSSRTLAACSAISFADLIAASQRDRSICSCMAGGRSGEISMVHLLSRPFHWEDFDKCFEYECNVWLCQLRRMVLHVLHDDSNFLLDRDAVRCLDFIEPYQGVRRSMHGADAMRGVAHVFTWQIVCVSIAEGWLAV